MTISKKMSAAPCDAFPGMLRKVGVCMEVCGDAFPGMCRV